MNPADRAPVVQPGQRTAQNAAAHAALARGPQRAARGADAADVQVAPSAQPPRNTRQANTQEQASIFAAAVIDQLANFRLDRTPIPQPPPPPINVLVSVNDGLIGSIYFPTGRVRLTHPNGPGMELKEPGAVQRFNINREQSNRAFIADPNNGLAQIRAAIDPELPYGEREMALGRAYQDRFDQWLANTLWNNAQPPDWAATIDGPGSVPRIDNVERNSGLSLYEVFANSQGRPNSSHFSRGEAAYIPMRPSTLDTIEEALRRITHIADPAQKNRVFYDHIREHAPDLADKISRP